MDTLLKTGIAGLDDILHGGLPRHLQTQANARGLGLGLYIARRIVELHGGVTSAGRGKGSTFTIRLPLGEIA